MQEAPDFSLANFTLSKKVRYVCWYLDQYSKNAFNSPQAELMRSKQKDKYMGISDSVCREVLAKYVIKDGKRIDGFIPLTTAMKILHYSFRALSQGPISLIVQTWWPEAQIQPLLSSLKARVIESILQTTDEYTTKIVSNLKELQQLTREALARKDDELNKQLLMLADKQTIIGWEKMNCFLIVMCKDGSWLPLYKQTTVINDNIKEFIYFMIQLDVQARSPTPIFDPIIKAIQNKQAVLEPLEALKEKDLMQKLLSLRSRIVNKSAESSYVLTLDNVLKMGLIYMRAEAKIPVVIMGETGCGKTSLLRFLATRILGEHFVIFNVHAGITERNIIEFMDDQITRLNALEAAEKEQATKQKRRPNCPNIWIFFDEFNTTNSLGLIKEIICDRHMQGKPLPKKMIFIAACNPFKLKTSHAFSTENLGIKKELLQSKSEQYKLMYTVHPLPETMLEYVWNFGSLKPADEKLYIASILQKVNDKWRPTFVELIAASQAHYKEKEGVSSVSLRDVRRFTIFYEWFELDFKERATIPPPSEFHPKAKADIDPSFRAALLSLLFCYYFRIQKSTEREEYLKNMVALKLPNSALPVTSHKEIEDILEDEQMYLLLRIKRPNDIALNHALRENIYVMFVCIMNRIPLFIIGKPGCSKSLSMQLLLGNLRGRASPDPYFVKLHELSMFYFQGSNSCTSAGIQEVFNRAEKTLSGAQERHFLPVFVFDEIGLAELSLHNPLKLFHSKLELDDEEDFKREKKVAFVGISNWRLDASKMNRALYLARSDPSENDLISTGQQICNSIMTEDKTGQQIDSRLTTGENKYANYIELLARAYFKFRTQTINKAEENYFGLRDFYNMVKQVARGLNAEKEPLIENVLAIILKAIRRNFAQLRAREGQAGMVELFQEILREPSFDPKLQQDTVAQLITSNLGDSNARFLMLVGGGDVPMYILEHCLQASKDSRRMIVGSQFRRDIGRERSKYKAVSDIIMYMEKGMSIMLQGMDEIYSSLYDLFNQNYSLVGGKKYCRIAIGGQYKPKCVVHPDFRCVIFLDERQLALTDPPFLNRFEKHSLSFDDAMDKQQKDTYAQLLEWLDKLLPQRTAGEKVRLHRQQAFMNYSEDFLKILVMKQVLDQQRAGNEFILTEVLDLCKRELLSLATLDLLVQLSESKIEDDEKRKVESMYQETHNLQFFELIETARHGKINKKLIYTYTPVLDTKKFLKTEKIDSQILHKCIFTYLEEEELAKDLNKFFTTPHLRLLILDFDSITDSEHLAFVRATFENAERDYFTDQRGADTVVKNVFFVIHVQRNRMELMPAKEAGAISRENEQDKLVIFETWDAMMIDDIEDNKTCLFNKEFLQKDIKQIIAEEQIVKLEDAIIEASAISIQRLRSESRSAEVKASNSNKISKFIKEIGTHPKLREAIVTKVKDNIQARALLEDWKQAIYKDAIVRVGAESTQGALKKYILEVVTTSLTNVLYTIENDMIIYSFVEAEPECKDLIKEIWLTCFRKLTVDPKLSFPQLPEQCVTSDDLQLRFPFSLAEYKACKESYADVINLRTADMPLRFSLQTYLEKVETKSPLTKEHFTAVNANKTVQHLYWSDLLRLYMKKDQALSIAADGKDAKMSLKLTSLFQKLLPTEPAREKLFYLLYCTSSLCTFIKLISEVEEQLQQDTLRLFESAERLAEEGMPQTELVLLQALSLLLDQICESSVLNAGIIASYNYKKYMSLLKTLYGYLVEFKNAANCCAYCLETLEFLERYGTILAYDKQESMHPIAEFVSRLTLKDKSKHIGDNMELFTTIRRNCLRLLQVVTNEAHRNEIRVLLAEWYINAIRANPILVKDYLQDYNAGELWKSSQELLDLLATDMDILARNFEELTLESDKLEDLKQKVVLEEIEKYFKNESLDSNYLSVVLVDAFVIRFEKDTIEDPGDMANELAAFKKACELLTASNDKPLDKLYSLAGLGYCRAFLQGYAKVLHSGHELTEPLLEVSKVLSTEGKLSATLSLFCCKELLALCKDSISELNTFMGTKVDKCRWMEQYLSREIEALMALRDKLPIFPEVQQAVDQFMAALIGQAKSKFASATEFVNRMKADLQKPQSAFTVLLGVLNVASMAQSSDPTIAADMATFFAGLSFPDVDDTYMGLVMLLAKNFPETSPLYIWNNQSTENNVKAIILRTLLVLMIGHKSIRNPLSCCFFDVSGKPAKLTTTFAHYFVPSAPYEPYLHLLTTQYMDDARKGYEMYQCSSGCPFVFFVDPFKKVSGSTKCLLCGQELSLQVPVELRPKRKISAPMSLLDPPPVPAPLSFKETVEESKCQIEFRIRELERMATKGLDLNCVKGKEKGETVRGIAPVTYRLFHLLAGVTLHFFLQIGKTSPTEATSFGLLKDGAELSALIKESLNILYDILNDPQAEVIIYAILNKLPTLLSQFSKEPTTIAIRNEFEDVVDKQLVKAVLEDIPKAKSECTAAQGKSVSIQAALLREHILKLDQNKYTLSAFFRTTKGSNREDFEKAFERSPQRNNFPLLAFTLKQKNELGQLRALYPALTFSNALLEYGSHYFRREELDVLTLADVFNTVEHSEEAKEKGVDRKYLPENKIMALCKGFINAWQKNVAECIKEIQSRHTKLPTPTFSDQDLVKDFIVGSQEEKESAMEIALIHLASYQNKVLEELAKLDDNSLFEKLRERKVKLQSLTSDSILSLQVELHQILRGVSDPRYGYDAEVFYDFARAERLLRQQFLGKVYIDTENLTKITFAGELLQNNQTMFDDIRVSGTQHRMTPQLRKQIREHFKSDGTKQKAKEDTYLRKLYESLNQIMYHMNKEARSMELAIGAFCRASNLTGLATDLTQSTLLSGVKLENLLEFYEIVEAQYFVYFRKYIRPEYKSKANRTQIKEIIESAYPPPSPESPPSAYPFLSTFKGAVIKLTMRTLTVLLSTATPIKVALNKIEYWGSVAEPKQYQDLLELFPSTITLADIWTLHKCLDREITRRKEAGIPIKSQTDLEANKALQQAAATGEEEREEDPMIDIGLNSMGN